MMQLKFSGLWAVTRKRPFSNWVFTFFASSITCIGQCYRSAVVASSDTELILDRMIAALIAESE